MLWFCPAVVPFKEVGSAQPGKPGKVGRKSTFVMKASYSPNTIPPSHMADLIATHAVSRHWQRIDGRWQSGSAWVAWCEDSMVNLRVCAAGHGREPATTFTSCDRVRWTPTLPRRTTPVVNSQWDGGEACALPGSDERGEDDHGMRHVQRPCLTRHSSLRLSPHIAIDGDSQQLLLSPMRRQ